jgi:hypothetical protein
MHLSALLGCRPPVASRNVQGSGLTKTDQVSPSFSTSWPPTGIDAIATASLALGPSTMPFVSCAEGVHERLPQVPHGRGTLRVLDGRLDALGRDGDGPAGMLLPVVLDQVDEGHPLLF